MTKRSVFLSGVMIGGLLGAFLLLAVIVFGLATLPRWLVVDQEPDQVDAIVVLGGGGGSRLRHAVQLYDRKVSGLLILVGEEEDDWQNILRNHCRECDLDHRQHVIINGSLTTMTDAELVRNHLKGKPVTSLLVVTDPYHTRRADIVFNRILSGVRVQTTSSRFYGKLLAPDEDWWRDRRTIETVWMELGKIIYFLATQMMFPAFVY